MLFELLAIMMVVGAVTLFLWPLMRTAQRTSMPESTELNESAEMTRQVYRQQREELDG